MNRYPRRWAVSIKLGVLASSPSASRNCLMQSFKTASPTNVSGQTASSNCCFVTRFPGLASRKQSTAYALGRRAIVTPSRCKHSFALSNQNGPKLMSICSVITRKSPEHDYFNMTLGEVYDYSPLHESRMATLRVVCSPF